MFFIIYVSSAVKLFSESELVNLLGKCHENNSKLGVTGMLLYKGGNFMQVLEGEEETVLDLYNKIAGDERHRGSTILFAGILHERQFPEWSMGFHNLNAPDILLNPGYNEFMNTDFTVEEFSSNPTYAKKLLLSFKTSM